jgi:hypothetical protein
MSPKSEVFHAIQFLFDGIDGEGAANVDRKMRELPGLEWFDLFGRFARHHQIRKAPASWIQPCAPVSEPRVAAIGA